MKLKPKTPYQRLLEDIRAWVAKLSYRRTMPMWEYPKGRLSDGWDLSGLYERVSAAEQLGYDVTLSAGPNGLKVLYVEKVPNAPWDWK